MTDHFLKLIMNIPGELAFGVVILVLILCGLGFPLPEEICIVAAAYLAHVEEISMKTAVLGVIFGMIVGDSLLYSLGYKFGSRIFEWSFFKKIVTPDRMKRANDYFHRWGNRVVFVARFVMGVRATVFLTAGILRMPYRRFLLFDGLAALISVPINLYIVHKLFSFGEELDDTIKILKGTGRGIMIIVLTFVVATSLIVYFRRRAIKHKKLP